MFLFILILSVFKQWTQELLKWKLFCDEVFKKD